MLSRFAFLLPVPLVARVLLAGVTDAHDLRAKVQTDLAALASTDAPLPRRGLDKVIADALARLRQRGLIGDDLQVPAESHDVLEYYAASIAAHFDAPAAKNPEISASAK